jgi:hypothetical protein
VLRLGKMATGHTLESSVLVDAWLCSGEILELLFCGYWCLSCFETHILVILIWISTLNYKNTTN